MSFTVTMPKLSPTMTEGTIATWHKKPGDFVEAGDVLLEISTDKATVEHQALDEGYLRKILQDDGSVVKVNDPLAIFTESADGEFSDDVQKKEEPAAVAAVKEEKKVETPEQKQVDSGSRPFASPLAKKLAKTRGIDLSTLSGSGPRGRIMSRDLEKAPTTKIEAKPLQKSAETTFETMSPMRKVIAKRLQESKQQIPHFYVKQEVDAEPIVSIRQTLKSKEKPYTVNDFILKAVAIALSRHPEINSGYDAQNEQFIRFGDVDISLAVTVDGGLITPIIKQADKKSIKAISEEAKALAGKAREGKLQPEEYQGGSFTLSNLGMFGITEMGAIINPPQGAILGVGAAYDAACVKDGKIVPGKKMMLTLSCDHRVIDGADGARFLKTLRELIENPLLFLSE